MTLNTVNALCVMSLFIISACASGPQVKARNELKNAHQIDYENERDLTRALDSNKVEIVKLFLQAHNGLPQFDNGWRGYWESAVSKATKEGHVDLVKAVLPYATDGMKGSIIWAATPAAWTYGHECNEATEEIMKLTIEAGGGYPRPGFFATYTGADIAEQEAPQIARSLCPKPTEMILKKYPEFSAKSAWNLTKAISSGLEDVEIFLTAPMQGRIEDTLFVVKDINKARCHQGNECAISPNGAR